MKAVTWRGVRDVGVEEVPDPFVEAPTDAVIRVTTSNICGSDLHLYEPMSPFMGKGDILGHENMGQVVEVGSECDDLTVGDRVAIPFQISCGTCWMCRQHLCTQCETTQVRDQGMGAALFGFSTLYGEVAGGQAEYLRVPQAQFTHITLPEGPPDDRFAYLSDILPTAWQGVEYAAVPEGGTLVVLGLDPIGDFACRIAKHKGLPGHRRRPGARAAGPRQGPRRRGGRPERGGGHRRRHPRHDQWPRPRLGARRRRHGGARLAGHQSDGVVKVQLKPELN